MRIKKILSDHGIHEYIIYFKAILECEGCGDLQKRDHCPNSLYFRDVIIPRSKCLKCKKSSEDRGTKVPLSDAYLYGERWRNWN